MAQIQFRVEIVKFGGTEQAVNDRCAFGAGLNSGGTLEISIVPANAA